MRSLFVICFLIPHLVVVAQEPTPPRASPMKSVNAKYYDGYVRIIYSSPLKNGREIFGKLVPYQQVWRTGANEATEMVVTKDILINNQLLKAGTYSLFTIPDKDKWTIIINRDLGLWGSYNYNEKLDVMRFDVPVQIENVVYEPFTLEFAQRNELADLLIRWDNVKIVVPFKFLN